MEYIIYTDGAFSSLRNQGGWAFVVIKDGEKIFSDYGTEFNTTNNRMEIQSVIEALKYLNSINLKEFTLFSDSMYVIGTLTQNWNKKKNVDLWLELDNVIKSDKINWKHIKGHSGDRWNSHCDMLAVHASQLIVS